MIYSAALKLGELAERLGCRLDGDGEVEVVRVAGIEHAGSGDLTFVSNPRYAAAARVTKASAIIIGNQAPAAPCAMLRCANPYLAFARAVGIFAEDLTPPPGIHPTAVVAADAEIADGASIGPLVCVESGARIGRSVLLAHVVVGPGASIGDDCFIHSNVSIREHVVIGHRVVIQDGVVIGSDGFGFAPRGDGSYEKIPQPGGVVIEDDVEIGANSAIDRPAVGETRICAGAKIDNLVQVAHGVRVGRHSILCAQVGIAGSTSVGDSVTLAGQVGVAGHIEIGSKVIATAQTGIANSVDEGVVISGYPAIPNRDWLRSSALFHRLPELKRTIGELEARIASLEQQLESVRRG